MKLRITVLGITGSVGKSLLEVVNQDKERIELIGISGWQNTEKLNKIATQYQPKKIVVKDIKAINKLCKKTRKIPTFTGEKGLLKIIKDNDYDLLFILTSGVGGLKPLYKALELGKTVALANKESLVIAGELIKKILKKKNGKIIPLDSEHNAIYQCLKNRPKDQVKEIILTASGGPFFEKKNEEFINITKKQALSHPNWTMGEKITIDSATMMNKCLEVIEAHWIFDLSPNKIKVVVHRQSKVHGIIQYKDGGSLAYLGESDMKLPIINSINHKINIKCNIQNVDYEKIGALNFYSVDNNKFPTVKMAYQVLKLGGGSGGFLNGANQKLVEYFLDAKIEFIDIFFYLNETIKQLNLHFRNKKDAPGCILKQSTIEDALKSNEAGKNFIIQTYKQ